MKMKVVLIGWVVFAVGMAHGALFVDGFESYSVGNTVYGSNGWTNLNTSATQGGWVASKESAFSSGSQSLHYTDTDSGGLYDPRVQNSLAESLTQGTFSFDFNVHAAQARNPSFFIRDSCMGTIGLMLNFMDVNGKVRYHNGSALVNVSETVLSLDTWYHVELTVNDLSGTADTFDIRVLEEDGGAGAEIINVSGLSCTADIASISMIEFATNVGKDQAGADFYLDNVQFPLRTIHVGAGADYTSISAALNVAEPHDQIIVHDGVYRESITINTNDITIIAAAGERPVIDGTTPITSVWTRASVEFPNAPIYTTSFARSTKQLFLDNEMMIPARWPNVPSVEALMTRAGWSMMDTSSGPINPACTNGLVVDEDLANVRDANGNVIDWNGAVAILNIYHQFFTFSRTVQSYTSGRFSYSNFPYALPHQGWMYFDDDFYYLTGVLGALDVPGEWFLDEAAGTIYVWAPDGLSPDDSGRQVSVKDTNRIYAVTAGIGVTDLKLEGLTFFGTTADFHECNSIFVENCHFIYPSYLQRIPSPNELKDPDCTEKKAYLMLCGEDSLIRDCSIAYASVGLQLKEGASAENCLIHDVEWTGNLGNDAVMLNGDEVDRAGTLRCSTIFDTGAPAVRTYRANDGVVELNHIHHAGMLSRDVTTLYSNGGINGDEGWGLELRYNWIHDGPGPHHQGIRADVNNSGVSIHHNLIWSDDRIGSWIDPYCNWQGIVQNCTADGLAWGGMTYNNTLIEPGPRPANYEGWQLNNAISVNQNDSGKGRDDHLMANNLLCHGAYNYGGWSIVTHSVPSKAYTNLPGILFQNATNNQIEDLFDPWYLDFRPVNSTTGYQHSLIVSDWQDIGAYEKDGPCWVPGHCNGLRLATNGAGSFGISLAMPVLSPVRVALSSSGGSASPNFLDFSSSNWDEPKTVSITGSTVTATVENWGAVTGVLSQVDSAVSAYVWFPVPDLGLDLPLKISGYQPGAYVWLDMEDIRPGGSITSAVAGWQTSYETAGQYTEISSEFEASPFVNYGNMQTLQYVDTDSTLGLYNLRFSCDDLGLSSSDTIKVSFDYYCIEAGMNPTFFCKNSNGAVGLLLSFDCPSNDRTVQNHTGTSLVNVSTNEMQSGKWYRFELTINPVNTSTDTFALRVTDFDTGIVIDASGLSFKTNVSDLDEIEFGTNAGAGGSGHECLYDNIRVVKIDPSVPALPDLLDPGFVLPDAILNEPVSWTNLIGVSMNSTNMVLTKTAVSGWTNSGACSAQWLSGACGVSFVVDGTNTTRFCGLSADDPNASYSSIDYALVANGSGDVLVYENGVWKGNFGPYLSSDNFRVERIGSSVSYYHNGSLIYSSTNECSATNMLVDCFIYDQDGALRNVWVWAEEISTNTP